ncbi:MAG: F0F1 ATP synthase subunit delta [Campylobacteraceae bacterium]
MSSEIAKKYVKALMQSFDEKKLKTVEDMLGEITTAFNDTKFITILSSTDIKETRKRELILSFLDTKDEKIINFFSLLSENGRLLLIPAIFDELKLQISIKHNIFVGKVISDTKVPAEKVKELENSFSKKFGATIKLESVVSDYPGIKIQLDDLGIESSFSLDRLKAQLTEHILKAI